MAGKEEQGVVLSGIFEQWRFWPSGGGSVSHLRSGDDGRAGYTLVLPLRGISGRLFDGASYDITRATLSFPPFFFETQMLVGYLLILEKLTTPDKNGALPELFTRAGLATPHSTVSRQRLARPLPPSGLFRPMGGARTDQGRQRRLCVKGTALGVEMWGRQRLLIGSAAFLV